MLGILTPLVVLWASKMADALAVAPIPTLPLVEIVIASAVLTEPLTMKLIFWLSHVPMTKGPPDDSTKVASGAEKPLFGNPAAV